MGLISDLFSGVSLLWGGPGEKSRGITTSDNGGLGIPDIRTGGSYWGGEEEYAPSKGCKVGISSRGVGEGRRIIECEVPLKPKDAEAFIKKMKEQFRKKKAIPEPSDFWNFAQSLIRHLESKSPHFLEYAGPNDRLWFKDVIEAYENNRWVIYTKFRQGGFTSLNLMYALWKAKQKSLRIMFWARTDRDCLDIIEKCRSLASNALLSANGQSHSLTIPHENQRHSIIEAHVPKACRGKSCDYLFIDEAAHIPNIEEEWRAVYPILATSGKCFVYSSPAYCSAEGFPKSETRRYSNWFRKIYFGALQNDNSFVVPPTIYPHVMYSEDQLRTMRIRMGERVFASEYMQCFL